MKKLTWLLLLPTLSHGAVTMNENVRGTNNAYLFNTSTPFAVVGSSTQFSSATFTVGNGFPSSGSGLRNLALNCVQFPSGFQCGPAAPFSLSGANLGILFNSSGTITASSQAFLAPTGYIGLGTNAPGFPLTIIRSVATGVSGAYVQNTANNGTAEFEAANDSGAQLNMGCAGSSFGMSGLDNTCYNYKSGGTLQTIADGAGVYRVKVGGVADTNTVELATAQGVFISTLTVSSMTISGAISIPNIGGSPTIKSSATVQGQFSVTAGHLLSNGGTAPTVTNCGAGPSPSITGTDVAGRVTVGGGANASCNINFGTAWGVTPSCVSTNNNALVLMYNLNQGTTFYTIGMATAAGGNIIDYHCIGQQ